MTDLASRLQAVRSSIAAECRRLQRVEPKLIVVTKNHPVQLANALYELGERDYGENRVQEALPKSREFEDLHPAAEVNWHLIGQ
ncbi:MAG: hypothetical protein RL140_593, partial [Actinomycetota bacterium]